VMIIIAIVVFTIWWINNKKQAEYIKSNSERYKALLDINKEYSEKVHDFPNKLEIGYRFETKSRYDNPNNREKVFKE
ncbi:MAG TPA: hypothetical protein VFC83_05045, partial [Erysipelotrichaceae bacterium]|nr:hypothetical protein [Erysipelotrichaceae bacterium]